ncbi:MAG: hypothetical protein WC277_08665 [Bacilli bacterium]
MAHKVVSLKRGFPYTSTTVPFQTSVGQIMGLLGKYKCARIGVVTEAAGDITTTTLVFERDGATYLVEFPITYYIDSRGKRLNMNISGRIIHDRLKALLIDVEIGYLDFSQAMMGYRALPDGSGKMISLQDAYERCGDQLPACGFDLRLALPGGGEPTGLQG